MKTNLSKNLCKQGLLTLGLGLLMTSCVDSYDAETFTSEVRNTTLSVPEVTTRSNPDGTKTIVEWPVVFGAGGVKLSLYNVDDAAAPKPLVVDTVIDGSKCELPRTEDTNYKLIIQTLGNEKYNNKESEVKEMLFTSWVPKINTEAIPSGTDLAKWMSDNKEIIDAQTEEFSIELEGGAEYTMSEEVNLGLHPFVLYTGNKANPATIKMGEKSGFVTEAGVKLKYLNIDCTDMTDKTSSVIKFPEEGSTEKIPGDADNRASWFINESNPIVFKGVNVTNLSTHLVWTSNVCWTVYAVLIENCVIGMDQVAMYNNGGNMLDMSYGFAYDIDFKNSTFYSTTVCESNGAFLIISSERPQRYLEGRYPTCDFTYDHCTFYNCNYGKRGGSVYMFAYGRLKGQSCCLQTFSNNICVNSSSARVCRGAILQGQNGNMGRMEFRNNTYWFDGEDAVDVDWDKGDRVGADPQLVQDPVTGIFKVMGAEVKAAGCGDPRGLE